MHSLLIAAGLFGLQTAAFPHVMNNLGARTALEGLQARTPELKTRQQQPAPGSAAAIAASKARGNCGSVPCLVFNEREQYVSTTGNHAFIAPKQTDRRGQCPGLNAAANHGYLKRTGISNILDTSLGLAQAYGLEPTLGAALAVIAIGTDGDPVTGTWSIGGPLPKAPIVGNLLGQGLGIDYSHNTYDNDASIARGDYYTNHGDTHSLIMERFVEAYNANSEPDRYSLHAWAYQYWHNVNTSIETNPYAFWGGFSGLVAPAAYNFAINFMSNHSAEEPNGYLDGKMFKMFFAVSGDKPENFVWNKGMERIPDNWYRRTSLNQYNLANVVQDLVAQYLAYPDSFRLGGNLGKVNTYEGFNFGDLTGGAINNAGDLLDPDTLGCFMFQFAKAGIPDVASTLLSGLSDLTNALAPLSCPDIGKLNPSTLNKFPGYKQTEIPAGFDKPTAQPF